MHLVLHKCDFVGTLVNVSFCPFLVLCEWSGELVHVKFMGTQLYGKLWSSRTLNGIVKQTTLIVMERMSCSFHTKLGQN